jgi:hypothetical protein
MSILQGVDSARLCGEQFEERQPLESHRGHNNHNQQKMNVRIPRELERSQSEHEEQTKAQPDFRPGMTDDKQGLSLSKWNLYKRARNHTVRSLLRPWFDARRGNNLF